MFRDSSCGLLSATCRFSRMAALGCLFGNPFSTALADDWNRFRGPNGTGVASELKLTGALTEDSILWKKEVPPGTSSPVIVANRLYLTSYAGEKRNFGVKRTLHCMDASTGEAIWTSELTKTRVEPATPPNGPATCSVACDGKHVVAFFPDAGLMVCTPDGKQKWVKDIGPFSSMHGLSASPIIHENKIILCVDQLADPFIIAIDLETGDQVWKTERLLGVTGGYSTPVIMELNGKSYVLSAAPGEMSLYDIGTGEKKTIVEGLTNAPVSTPVVVGNQVFYTEPPGEPIPMQALGNADKNGDGTIEYAEVEGSLPTLRLIKRIDSGFGNSDGKVTLEEWDRGFGTFLNRGGFACVEFEAKADAIEGKVVWKYQKATPYIPSTIVLNGVAYSINDGGILVAFDTKSGEMIQRERLRGATGSYYASPIAGGTKMVLASLDGKITLVDLSDKARAMDPFSLDESIVATPSIAGGLLFVRSEGHLYCFGQKG